jgi:flavin reductase (DIM6/NTAB) family NADH-FMN oxidoreductase RutF
MGIVEIDPAEHPGLRPPGFRHSIYGSLVVPRPIGWISTVSAGGVVNLAPFSFFNLVANDPLSCMYCANGAHREGGPKDSLLNAQETGEFVFNLATWDLAEQMNLTSASSPRTVDEMAAAGLAPAASVKVAPPRVATTPLAMECVVDRIVPLPSSERTTNSMVIGRVVLIHLADDVVVDGMIDPVRMRPLARLGYHDYSVIDKVFSLLRPD